MDGWIGGRGGGGGGSRHLAKTKYPPSQNLLAPCVFFYRAMDLHAQVNPGNLLNHGRTERERRKEINWMVGYTVDMASTGRLFLPYTFLVYRSSPLFTMSPFFFF